MLPNFDLSIRHTPNFWLGRLAGVTSGLLGLWVLGTFLKDVLDPRVIRTDAGWAIAFGLLNLIGASVFLVELERPRSRGRQLAGWAMMFVGVAIPTSLTFLLIPLVALGALAFVRGRLDSTLLLVAAATLFVVGLLFTFSGGWILWAPALILAGVALVGRR